MIKKPGIFMTALLAAAITIGTVTVVHHFVVEQNNLDQAEMVIEQTNGTDDRPMDDETIDTIEIDLTQPSDTGNENESSEERVTKGRQKYGSVTSISTASQVSQLNIQKEPMVLKFYTNWCPACVASTKPYEELAQQFDTVHFYAVNIEENGMLKALDDAGVTPEPITRIPTFVLWKPGNPPQIVNGFHNLQQAIIDYFG